MMSFAQRFERLRFSLRMAPSQLAEIFGCEPQSMNNWLSGRTIPALEFQRTLLRLESDSLAAISPNLRPETIRAFEEGRARARCAQ
jgi:transcriptional regulator with XRE-family HTH domain